jgi:hypothetical protein
MMIRLGGVAREDLVLQRGKVGSPHASTSWRFREREAERTQSLGAEGAPPPSAQPDRRRDRVADIIERVECAFDDAHENTARLDCVVLPQRRGGSGAAVASAVGGSVGGGTSAPLGSVSGRRSSSIRRPRGQEM